MDYWLLVAIQLITIIIIFIGGLFLKNYLPSYMTEKGKNLATKEDISVITDLIESVKSTYAEDLQRIKTILDAQGQRYLHLYEKRSDALAQFFEDSSVFSTRLRSSLIFPTNDIQALDGFIQQMSEMISRVLASEHRLKIYLPPGEIIDTASDVAVILFELHQKWPEEALALRKIVIQTLEEVEKGIHNPNNIKMSTKRIYAFMTRYSDEIDGALVKYVKALNGHLNAADAESFLAKAAAVRFDGVADVGAPKEESTAS